MQQPSQFPDAFSQAAMLQQGMLMQQQQGYYNAAVMSPMSQLEPLPSGNLPPGFDPSSCRSVYVGNISIKVTESMLSDIFGSVGMVEGFKLIRKEKSSYGFVDFFDHRSAAAAIMSLNGRQLFGQPIKVNWAYASGQREDTSSHVNIFVGDLSAEVTDAALYSAFSVYPSCSDARVMWDHKTGRSRGFGFVSFRSQTDAETAISEMTGKWLGTRQIRCNWATKGAGGMMGGGVGGTSGMQAPLGSGGGQQGQMAQVAGPLTSSGAMVADGSGAASANPQGSQTGQAGGEGSMDVGGSNDGIGPAMSLHDDPSHNSLYTTVYVGNLAHEVSQTELHRQFYALNAGAIEEVRVQRDKGFGFVRYSTHEEASAAIQAANGRVICGKSVKCSWGNKPRTPGLPASPLPPPPPPSHVPQPFYSSPAASSPIGYGPPAAAADLLAFQRLRATMPQLTQQQLAAAAAGMGSMNSLGAAGGLGSMGALGGMGMGMGGYGGLGAGMSGIPGAGLMGAAPGGGLGLDGSYQQQQGAGGVNPQQLYY